MSEWCTRQEALNALFKKWNPERQKELLELDKVSGRIAGEDIFSRNTLPVWRTSAMDGIAVSSAAFCDGMPDTSTWEYGREFIRADTGDDFDDAYDTIILVEDIVISQDNKLTIKEGVCVRPGMNVNPEGSQLLEGDLLVTKGTRLLPMDMSLLAMGGIHDVPVKKQPRVAFIPTGTELVPVAVVPRRGQNVDSNSVLVKGMLEEYGALPVMFPITKDVPGELEQILEEALFRSDIVIINGGSSKGLEDYTIRILQKRGTIIQHGVLAAPGGPVCLAMVDGKAVINLPGPAFAAFHVMTWCLREIIAFFLEIPVPEQRKVQAVLLNDVDTPVSRDFMCRMLVRLEAGVYTARHIPFEGISLAHSMAANGIYISPVGESSLKKGQIIEVNLLRDHVCP